MSSPTGRPTVIGLTGNIASGKSLVGRVLAQMGAVHGDVFHGDVFHIDADRLAHQVMEPGTEVWQQIVGAFGSTVLGCVAVKEGAAIDRAKLGAIVFADAAALARLEAIVHPAVIARTEQRIAKASALGAQAVVVEAIKLIESGMVRSLCDVVWVVTAPREVRLERLVSQRGLTRAAAELRIDAQPPESLKIAHADTVIDNSGTIEETIRQVERAWAELARA